MRKKVESGNKIELLDLLLTDDWVSGKQKTRIPLDFPPDGLRVGLHGAPDKTKKIHICLGLELMKKLNIKVNNRVALLYHPDNICVFKLIKSPSGNKVKNEGRNFISLSFKAHSGFQKTQSCAPEFIDYIVHNEMLAFRYKGNMK